MVLRYSFVCYKSVFDKISCCCGGIEICLICIVSQTGVAAVLLESNSEWDGCPTSLAPVKLKNFCALEVNVLCAVGTEGLSFSRLYMCVRKAYS